MLDNILREDRIFQKQQNSLKRIKNILSYNFIPIVKNRIKFYMLIYLTRMQLLLILLLCIYSVKGKLEYASSTVRPSVFLIFRFSK